MLLEEFPQQLVPCAHHTSGSYATGWSQARAGIYGVTSIPDVYFDGLLHHLGASSCIGAANTYRPTIQNRLSVDSPVSIEGVHSIDGNTVSVDVTFTLVDQVTLINPSIHIIVQESNVGGEFHWVTRDAYSQAVSLVNQGDEVTISRSFTGAWNMEEITIAACIQKMTHPEEVYQAARVPMVQDFQIAYTPPLMSIPGGNGTAEFTGTLTNVGSDPDVFTVDLNDGFGWPSVFMLEGEGGFHTSPSVVALGVGESIGIYLNVTTDSDVRIGVGGLQCHSANTEHTGDVNARVFNGSPAIMFVDDDRNRSDELEIETALDSKNLLYDSWDVYFEQAEHNPVMADLDGYDVVLWHQGWNWGPRFDEAAMNTMIEYMDGGGGVIMSAQEFLSFIDPHLFTTDYLGISTWTAQVGAEWAYGQAGDPISDGLDFDLEYPSSSLNKADHLVPAATASVVFQNENGDNIGIRNETRGMRSVCFAFGTNAIAGGGDPEGLATMLENAIGWLAQTSQGVDDVIPVNGLSAITGIEPNPFSLGTAGATIRLNLSETAARGQATLQLMDVTGRLVRDLSDHSFQVGQQSLSWDGMDTQGRPVEAGVYYLNFNTADNSANARVVVIR